MRAIVSIAVAFASLFQSALASDGRLPKDVQTYMERRAACDHWRGEEPYDEGRRAEINRNACELCQGADAGLAKLLQKYKTRSDVADALRALEPRIELPNPKAMAVRCEKAVRASSGASSDKR